MFCFWLTVVDGWCCGKIRADGELVVLVTDLSREQAVVWCSLQRDILERVDSGRGFSAVVQEGCEVDG